MQGIGLALAAAALFGAAAPACKLLLGSFGAFTLAGLLYLGAALATSAPWWRELRAEGRPRLDAGNRKLLLGAIAAGGLVAPVLMLFALHLTLAGDVALLLNLELAAAGRAGSRLRSSPRPARAGDSTTSSLRSRAA